MPFNITWNLTTTFDEPRRCLGLKPFKIDLS